ncbi:MAG: trypsin-like peptidase domain-containing protein [Candidatus Saccharimonadales bacterium]
MKHKNPHKKANKEPKTHHELHHAHIKKSKRLKRTALLMNILFVLTAIYTGLAIYVYFTAHSKSGIESIRSELGLNDTSSKYQTINSSAGFSLTYDNSAITAQGLVFSDLSTNPSLYSSGTGPTKAYASTDLGITRDYGVVNFWTSADSTSLVASKSQKPWQMRFVSDSRTHIFDEGRKQYGSSLSDLDLAVKLYAPVTQTNSYTTITPSESSQADVTISNLHYRKVVYTMTDSSFPTSSYSEVHYVTVQNGRPYAFILIIKKDTPQGDIDLLQQVIRAIHYNTADPKALVSSALSQTPIKLAAVSNPLPSGSINLPSVLSDGALKIVANNQPAVARVASISCYDFNLLLPSGSIAYSVKDACQGIVGSGSILSNDGYLSTNGHVVDVTPTMAFQMFIELSTSNGNNQPLTDYLHYLINTNVATKADLNALIAAIKGGDQNALQTLFELTSSIPASDYQLTSSKTVFGVQLSDVPVKVTIDGTHLSFQYSSTVVPATLIGDNYDATANVRGGVNFTTYSGTDVALLKLSGKNFPVISLGKTAGIQPNDYIYDIGWPGFVDGGLETTKSTTIPTATAGTVVSIQNEASGPYKLIVTDAPIAEGNSGGPAFNSSGQQIGLTTYGVGSADPNSGVSKESPGGVLRTVDDIEGLLNKYGVTLKTSSQVNTLWSNVINDFIIGHFKNAVILTDQVHNLYPASYLADSFKQAALSQIAQGHDTSGPNLKIIIGAIVSAVFLIAGAVVIVIYILHHRKGKTMGYHLPLGSPPPLPSQANAQAYAPAPSQQPPVVVSPQNVQAAPVPQPPSQPTVQPPHKNPPA